MPRDSCAAETPARSEWLALLESPDRLRAAAREVAPFQGTPDPSPEALAEILDTTPAVASWLRSAIRSPRGLAATEVLSFYRMLEGRPENPNRTQAFAESADATIATVLAVEILGAIEPLSPTEAEQIFDRNTEDLEVPVAGLVVEFLELEDVERTLRDLPIREDCFVCSELLERHPEATAWLGSRSDEELISVAAPGSLFSDPLRKSAREILESRHPAVDWSAAYYEPLLDAVTEMLRSTLASESTRVVITPELLEFTRIQGLRLAITGEDDAPIRDLIDRVERDPARVERLFRAASVDSSPATRKRLTDLARKVPASEKELLRLLDPLDPAETPELVATLVGRLASIEGVERWLGGLDRGQLDAIDEEHGFELPVVDLARERRDRAPDR